MIAVKLGRAVRLVRGIKPHHARTFAKTVVPEVVRPARVIWNQAVGLVFFLIAIPAISEAWKHYRALGEDSRSGFGLALSILVPIALAGFGIVMAAFGIASFIKARRIASRL